MQKEKMPPKSTEIPLYVDAYNQILEIIKTSEPGSRLPTEETLAKKLSISRNTLRQALQILQEDRIIYKRRGSGTYISGTTPILASSNLNEYCTIEELFKKQGIYAELLRLDITIEDSDEICSELLDLPVHTNLLVANRVYCDAVNKDKIYTQSLDFIPHTVFYGEAIEQFDKKALVSFAEKKGVMAQCSIIATHAGKLNAKIMKVSEHTPLILLQQLVMSSTGEKLYLNKTYINSQTTEFPLNIIRN